MMEIKTQNVIILGMHKRIHGIRSIVRETEEDPSRRRGSFDSELIIPHNIQYATQHSRVNITISNNLTIIIILILAS